MTRDIRHRLPLFLVLLAVVLVAMSAGRVRAQQGTESFSATHFAELRGEDEVEAVTDTARGYFFARVNVGNKMMRYRLTVGGLSNIIGAGIFRGGYGQEGVMVLPLPQLIDTTMTVTGQWSMSQGEVDSLLAGFLHVNVRTAAHPNGHIRSQIMPVPNALTPGITARQETHSVLDTLGSGESFIHIDQATKVLYYWFRWRNLSGPVTAAHFHLGPVTVAGPPIKPVEVSPGMNIATGSWQLDDTTYEHVLTGQVYVNFHTAKNPQGEIRGQIIPAHVFTAALDPANSVPSHVDSSAGAGSGFVVIGLTPFGNVLDGRAIVNSTTSPPSIAHVHIGPIGQEGPVFQPMNLLPGTPTWGVPGGVTRLVSEDTTAIFLANGAYMNFHTPLFPRGEIRGQLIPAATNLSFPTTSVPSTTPAQGRLIVEYLRGQNVIVVHLTAPTTSRSVRLHDALGRVILSASIEGGTARIPANDLSSGIYLVDVEGYQVGRVVVRR